MSLDSPYEPNESGFSFLSFISIWKQIHKEKNKQSSFFIWK